MKSDGREASLLLAHERFPLVGRWRVGERLPSEQSASRGERSAGGHAQTVFIPSGGRSEREKRAEKAGRQEGKADSRLPVNHAADERLLAPGDVKQLLDLHRALVDRLLDGLDGPVALTGTRTLDVVGGDAVGGHGALDDGEPMARQGLGRLAVRERRGQVAEAGERRAIDRGESRERVGMNDDARQEGRLLEQAQARGTHGWAGLAVEEGEKGR